MFVVNTLFIKPNELISQEKSLHIGFVTGLAVPNDKVSQFFNESSRYFDFDSIKAVGHFILDKAASMGYKICIKGRISLSDNIMFVPAIGIARFNEGRFIVEIPGVTNDSKIEVQTLSNVMAIGTGINGYLFKSFFSLYFTAELTYNYLAYSSDYVWTRNISIPIFATQFDNSHKLGYSFGGGIDMDLNLLSLNLEVKLNTLNIIKASSFEPTKNHFSITCGVIF